ncbi:MAG: hypothetical protein ACR2LT_00755 [Pyrinomonadaceae bacterium]
MAEIKNSRDYADQPLMQAGVKVKFEPFKSALEDCRKAIAALEQIAERDPKNKEAKFDVAMAYYQTSNLLQKMPENMPQAIIFMRRATEELEKLYAENPDDREIAENLHSGFGRLSGINKIIGNNLQSVEFQKKSEIYKSRNF